MTNEIMWAFFQGAVVFTLLTGLSYYVINDSFIVWMGLVCTLVLGDFALLMS